MGSFIIDTYSPGQKLINYREDMAVMRVGENVFSILQYLLRTEPRNCFSTGLHECQLYPDMSSTTWFQVISETPVHPFRSRMTPGKLALRRC